MLFMGLCRFSLIIFFTNPNAVTHYMHLRARFPKYSETPNDTALWWFYSRATY